MSATTATALVLLIEDEAILRLDLEQMLEGAGFELISLHSATTAIGEIEKDCTRFGGLVTDIDLGNGPSGWDVARRARELCPSLPVVYMSGASAADWAAQGVPKSILLSKPFAPAQLITAISTLMNEAPILGDS